MTKRQFISMMLKIGFTIEEADRLWSDRPKSILAKDINPDVMERVAKGLLPAYINLREKDNAG